MLPAMPQEIAYGGWSRCLELANGHIRLIATTEVGPRILFCGPPGGPNLFKEFPKQAGKLKPRSPDPQNRDWLPWGGHRLWIAPEGDHCYDADNQPVTVELLGPDAVRLTAPEELAHGWQRGMEIHLLPGQPRARIIHRLTALRPLTTPCALWALSIMDAGGCARIPQPPPGSHPEDLLPNRNLIVWPYVSLQDPRLTLGSSHWEVRQQPPGPPLKIGLLHRQSSVDYLNQGWRFTTHFPPVEDKAYPDLGVNCEIFTNPEILEVESLSPLLTLDAGQTATHTIEWSIHPA
jgi:hypothetical protein